MPIRELSEKETAEFDETPLIFANGEIVDGAGLLGKDHRDNLYWLERFCGPLGDNPEKKVREFNEAQRWHRVFPDLVLMKQTEEKLRAWEKFLDAGEEK